MSRSNSTFQDESELTQVFMKASELLRSYAKKNSRADSDAAMKELKKELSQLSAQYPDSVPALRLLAECEQQLGNLDKARGYIGQAERLKPWDLEILIISESLHEASACEKEVRPGEPLRLRSDVNQKIIDAEFLQERAMGSFRLGDLERAYTLSKLAYRINPDNEYLIMDVLATGSALDPSRTKQELIQLEKEGSENPYLYLALGSVLNIMGHYFEAVDWLNKGLSLPIKDPYAKAMLFNELAYVLTKEGRQLDTCILLARKALDIFPDNQANGFIRDTLGVIYLKQGFFEKATANLREAVQKDPAIVPQFHLALALIHQHEAKESLSLLDSIATARPSLETPHVEESKILHRVQTHILKIRQLLNLGGNQDLKDVLDLLNGLV